MLTGILLPIITPFKDNKIDYKSYKRLIDHYVDKGISGIIPLGTTGEVPTINEYDFREIIEKTMEFTEDRLPVYVGVGGNFTEKIVKKVRLVEDYNVKGILSVCPYYNKPNQEGIYQHFKNISENTNLDIILYNIPYRTGVNIENETIYKLAELKNIVGLKDASGDIKQTMALLMDPPKDFSILTGEDILFFSTLALGGQGGILASSHLKTELFVEVYHKMKANDTQGALKIWKDLYEFIPLLFKEPNPAPIKYCLMEQGLIDSAEVRLPLTPISTQLEIQLDKVVLAYNKNKRLHMA
ncbi:4-hydroxy-tetrahydrodipicolinate synthase [Mobilitalea sibirica]|uniref:4-hydroxy-tetrahydrodipicolinate synthase n=1 Tax=Mobilitalea sibirica TaxID=1462919 RepID=A0A8J7H7K2_9FIRM|nr:4-hydroxy-tetrahydrodipicolinate synthase [Mobilitalea sibirica]MBH1939500.1 4-hydroxy-tetrahydrodipicolinate synthase [Mobilitalea sibirica]